MGRRLLQLLSGAGLSCLGLVVGIAFGLILTPYLVSSLGDASYGIYVMASLFAGWCGLLDFGLTTTTSRYITRYYVQDDKQGVNEVGSTAILLFGGISFLVFLASIAAFFAASLWTQNLDPSGELSWALFLSGTSFAISKISDGVAGVIRGSLHYELTGGTTLVFRFIWGLVTFGILYFGGRVRALCLGSGIVTALQLLTYIVLVRHSTPSFVFSFKKFRKDRARELLGYGFYAFLAQIGELAVNRSDLIIIAALMSSSDVGRYNLVVVTLTSYFNSFLTEASTWETNWFTRSVSLSEREAESGSQKSPVKTAPQNGKRLYSEDFYISKDWITRVSIYATIFMSFGLIAIGPSFLERWIGKERLSCYPALFICALALGIYRGASEVNNRALQGVARHKIYAYGAIVHGVLNVVLSVVLVKLGMGLQGVALGGAAPGFFIWYLWVPMIACRILGEDARTYWRRQLRATVIAILALVAPTLCVTQWIAPTYPRVIGLSILAFVLYFPTVWKLGFSSQERAVLISNARSFMRKAGTNS